MKVCVLAFAHTVNDGRVLRQAIALRDGGHDVCIVGRGATRRLLRRSVINEIPVMEIFAKPMRLTWRLLIDPFAFICMCFVALFQRGKVNLYYCHEYQSLMIGWLAARTRKAKVVYDCHEYQPESCAGIVGSFCPRMQELTRRWFLRYENFWMRRTDAFVTVNDDLADRLRDNCPRGVVIPNYPTKAEFDNITAPQAWIERLTNKTVLIFVGYLSPTRGVTMCIRLLAELRSKRPDLCLLLVGAVNSVYRREIETLTTTLRVRDSVYLTGAVPHHELIRFLPLGHIAFNLIQPDPPKNRWAEPTKCFQYAAAGLPVISSNLEASRRVIEQMENGLLVEPDDLAGAVKAAESLLSDTTLRERLGERGRSVFLTSMNAEKVSTRLQELVMQLQNQGE